MPRIVQPEGWTHRVNGVSTEEVLSDVIRHIVDLEEIVKKQAEMIIKLEAAQARPKVASRG